MHAELNGDGRQPPSPERAERPGDIVCLCLALTDACISSSLSLLTLGSPGLACARRCAERRLGCPARGSSSHQHGRFRVAIRQRAEAHSGTTQKVSRDPWYRLFRGISPASSVVSDYFAGYFLVFRSISQYFATVSRTYASISPSFRTILLLRGKV